jgi:integrase
MRELNDAYLRSLEPPAEGRLEVRDSRVRGLVLRMTKGGAATWSVRARTRDGKQTRPTLGTWPAVGVGEARKNALGALAAVQSGADPVEAKRTERAARQARKKEATVTDRLAAWRAARNADPAAPWSDRYAAEVARLCKKEIEPRLGKKLLIETTRADWTGLIAAKHRRAPGVGAMLYRTCAAFLNHAEAHGWVPLPLLPRKGAAIIAPMAPARERVLTDADLLAVWQAADREAPKLRAFVRLLILTAARELEVADLEAGEIDRQAASWTIPAHRAKNGHELTVPLGRLAMIELGAIWPNEDPSAETKLLGRFPASGFRGFSRLKERIDAASGVTEWRWHDLRRTARTGMTRLGVARDHAEAALNHVSGRSALERTYDRHDYASEALTALTVWQAHVAELVSKRAAAPARRSVKRGSK